MGTTDFDDVAEFEMVECIRETSLAALIALDAETEWWVPKSQIDDSSEVFSVGDEGTLITSAWYAEQEGKV